MVTVLVFVIGLFLGLMIGAAAMAVLGADKT